MAKNGRSESRGVQAAEITPEQAAQRLHAERERIDAQARESLEQIQSEVEAVLLKARPGLPHGVMLSARPRLVELDGVGWVTQCAIGYRPRTPPAAK